MSTIIRGLCLALLSGAVGFASAGAPQSAPASATGAAWDTTLARGTTRTIDFTTDVGTWMSVDLSPDGRWIVFDLLSHIYRVPAAGGDAECLTQDSGVALNYHPRYSPDGTAIAFVSDRGGQNHLWLMDADGRNPRQVRSDVVVTEIAWTPDSQSIVVTQSGGGGGAGRGSPPTAPAGGRGGGRAGGPAGGGGGGIWMYPRDGGPGKRLTAGNWPSISKDGRYLFFQAASAAPQGDTRIGHGDLLGGSRQVRRLTIEGGEVLDITAGRHEQQQRGSSGGAIAPEISPDGRWLAFSRRMPGGTISYKGQKFGPRSALWLRDLHTGAERLVMDPIEQDMAEGVKTLRVLPGYAWTADGKAIVLSQGGRLRRLDVATGTVTTIPFTARVRRTISEQVLRPLPIGGSVFDAKYLRWHTASPDGKTLAFQAVGRIWLQDLPSGTPRRLTSDAFAAFESSPAWSPDGRTIAFTTWDEANGGHVWTIRVGGAAPVQLTKQPGEYFNPSWRGDGAELVVARGSGATFRGRSVGENEWFDVVRLPAGGGEPALVAQVSRVGSDGLPDRNSEIVHPSYGANGRIYFAEHGVAESASRLVSVDARGGDKTVVATFADAVDGDVTLSPDGRWIAFGDTGNVWLHAVPADAKGPVAIEASGIRPVSRTGGLGPHWRNAQTLAFGSGSGYFVHRLADSATEEVRIRLSVPREEVRGSIALRDARLVTFGSPSVIERGTIVIADGRIKCVGTCATDGVDKVIDARGKTIIPGFVDMHAHHYRDYNGIVPSHGADNASYLAYGVTSALDPAGFSRDLFTSAELIDAGRAIGPRTFGVGESFMSNRSPRLTSYEAAEEAVARLKSWGAVQVKNHGQQRREQSQWLAEAARKLGQTITVEGNDLNHDIGIIMDGYTGIEHMLSYMPIYPDVARFFGEARIHYDPTVLGAGPAAWPEEYFFAKSDLLNDPKQQLWVPWRKLVPPARRTIMRPESDYSLWMASQGMADVVAAGGYGSIGGHFQQPTLSTHWNIWAAARAMGAHDALKVASLHGAHFLGIDRDVGSLETGKLADLIVLDSNPLEAIERTTDILYVMKGGVLYNADTLDEEWPRARPFGAYPWRNPDIFRTDDRPVEYWDKRP